MPPTLLKLTKHQQLSEVLRREFLGGKYGPGEAIPSQNVLAERHAVSVTTVREALSALAEQGIIERIQGKGTFLSEGATKPARTALKHVALVTAHLDLPYHAEFTHWIEIAMRRHNLSLVLNSWESFSEETRDTIQSLLKDTEGVIVGPIDDKALFDFLLGGREAPQNLVAFGSPEPLNGHQVTIDMSAGITEAVEHLVEFGHKRIWFLTGETGDYVYGRRRGFSAALRKFELDPDDCRVIQRNLLSYRQVAYRLAQEVLESGTCRPTALIVHNDNAAFGVFRALREAGLRVPDDISLVGCDNVSLAQYAPVPLTTIDLRIQDVAQMAGQIMTDVVNEEMPANGKYKHICLSSRLVVRESTGRAPSH